MGKRAVVSPEISAAEAPEESAEVGLGPGLSLFDASGDNRVRCLRRDEKTQKWTTHGYFPPGVTEGDVLKEFGGGTYWMQLLVQGPEGGESIKQSRQMKLVGAYHPPIGDLPGIRDKSAVATAMAVPSGGGGDSLSAMFNATIMTAFMDMVKTMKEVSTRPAPTTDPLLLEMMKAQANVQSKMIELMVANSGNNRGDSKKDVLEMMESMKGLLTPPPAPVVNDPEKQLTSLVGAIKQLRDVSEEFRPDTGTGDPLMDSIPKLVEVVAEQHQMQKAAAVRSVKPSLTSPVHQAQLPAGENVPLWKRVLQREGPRFVAAAQAGRNPETIAAVSVEFMPPNIVGAMREFFHRTTTEVAAQIIAEIPALTEQPVWVTEFVEHAQFLMFPDEFDEDGERIVETATETQSDTDSV